MSTRYAIILTDADGNEVVSDIKQMEGAAPQVPSGYKAVKVPDGVQIGMIKGGPVNAVGGYGFPEGSPAPVRSPTGVTTAEDSKAAKSKAAAE
ncbi:hypothetical protein [Mesorhizobium sp. B2-6-7]|uniref:hypothetical protein n=1 Tax=Mesorhizobium sp. B2-6-7 TaxID=2589910 RepID=UPI001128F3F3|nr:hypothetical protein [Mesorhizobium sp. B2-6-7]TPJ70472.1 hypothetical protein FJ462_07190 [Mesorhizobium sp. B2-6-7]